MHLFKYLFLQGLRMTAPKWLTRSSFQHRWLENQLVSVLYTPKKYVSPPWGPANVLKRCTSGHFHNVTNPYPGERKHFLTKGTPTIRSTLWNRAAHFSNKTRRERERTGGKGYSTGSLTVSHQLDFLER